MSSPFGLTKGMHLQEIDSDAEDLGYGVYQIRDVPKPHSAFECYIVRVAPAGGLYAVKAIGRDVLTGPVGYELRVEFNNMKQKLSAAYGNHREDDFLQPGSELVQSIEWMRGLLANERILAAFWDREEKSSLPDDIESIGLQACARSTELGCIMLEYQFNNSKVCLSELAAAEDDAL